MTLLLDQQFDRTLDGLLARFANGDCRGTRIEAWLFEDIAARADAEQRLAQAGVRARLRSAYKPLIHFFLEDAPGPYDAVTVTLPSDPHALEQRFRLETFPLAGLLGAASLRFAVGEPGLDYRVVLVRGGHATEQRVFAPNRLRQDHLGQTVLTPTGWLRVWHQDNDGPPDEDAALPTEYETVSSAALDTIAAHPWPATWPYFDVLRIEIRTPGIERRLNWHDECLSTAEGLHEDLYFSLLEIFQRRSGLKLGDRTLQPGQIVPDIHTASGPAHVRVKLEASFVAPEPPAEPIDIEISRAPLTRGQIHIALDALGGTPIRTVSAQGREVKGRFLPGTGRGFVVTAGQHANETTGVVGALRAAPRLRDAGAHFAVIPQENADGYALHHALRVNNPRHMHHAARYTALGDDLQYRTREPLYEKAARLEALRLTDAGLHLNLHGYPAHEWNRPLTGYITRGFEAWSMPKGFYLILHHPPGQRAAAEAFLEALTARVVQVPGLLDFNQSQLAVWYAHAGHWPEPIYHSIPCTITESTHFPAPYTLITEYPDETIYDAAFQLGHTVQTTTVLEAVALYRAGMLPTANHRPFQT
jgi:hypothetical protein